MSVSASFNYRLEPAVSVQGCTAYCTLSSRICLGIYDSQPASTLELDTWYQTRTLTTCGSGWFVSRLIYNTHAVRILEIGVL